MIFSARRQPMVRMARARTRGLGSAVSYREKESKKGCQKVLQKGSRSSRS